jgi:hypothetical protein
MGLLARENWTLSGAGTRRRMILLGICFWEGMFWSTGSQEEFGLLLIFAIGGY